MTYAKILAAQTHYSGCFHRVIAILVYANSIRLHDIELLSLPQSVNLAFLLCRQSSEAAPEAAPETAVVMSYALHRSYLKDAVVTTTVQVTQPGFRRTQPPPQLNGTTYTRHYLSPSDGGVARHVTGLGDKTYSPHRPIRQGISFEDLRLALRLSDGDGLG